MKWKVKYKDLRAMKTKRPFYLLEEIVEANTRKEAIQMVKNEWDSFGHYGNYSASRIK